MAVAGTHGGHAQVGGQVRSRGEDGERHRPALRASRRRAGVPSRSADSSGRAVPQGMPAQVVGSMNSWPSSTRPWKSITSGQNSQIVTAASVTINRGRSDRCLTGGRSANPQLSRACSRLGLQNECLLRRFVPSTVICATKSPFDSHAYGGRNLHHLAPTR
jgi:hypothetical protein